MPKTISVQHYSDVDPEDWVWPNFSPAEIACRHCGKLHVETEAMDLLQRFRDKVGKPFIVTSGYRCPVHNSDVGGAKKSQHIRGRAFDISMANHNPNEFQKMAVAIGFTGIGTYPPRKNGGHNFIHIDTRPGGPARWGDPFPPSQADFTPEPRPSAMRKGTIDAAAIMVPVAAAHEAAQKALPEVAPALPENWVTIAAACLAVVGATVAFWRAWKEARSE